jgi:hypothetical protein
VFKEYAPTVLEYEPQEQALQGSSLQAEYVPAGHGVQATAPGVIETDPGMHVVQAVAPLCAE